MADQDQQYGFYDETSPEDESSLLSVSLRSFPLPPAAAKKNRRVTCRR
jgi:hypothetical protein